MDYGSFKVIENITIYYITY